MDIKKAKKDELELLSYADISYHLLKQDNKPKTTAQLFKKIVKLLKLPEKTFEEQIADFYTSLTTDKRFLIIDGKWDLRFNHSSDKLDNGEYEDEEDDEEIIEEDEEEFEEEDEEYEDDEEDKDKDDLEGLVIIEEDELEE